MLNRPTRWMATAALVVGTLTACQDGQLPTSLDSTTETFSADVIDTSTYDVATGYTVFSSGTLLETSTAIEPGNATIAVVGVNGGTISTGEHLLEIPRGAVSEDTEFSMEVKGGSKLLVDLSARRVSSGETVSAFPVPLTLTLSYRGFYTGKDVKRLRNVYLYLDSPSYLVPLISRLDRRSKTLASPIWHFSLYGMAIE